MNSYVPVARTDLHVGSEGFARQSKIKATEMNSDPDLSLSRSGSQDARSGDVRVACMNELHIAKGSVLDDSRGQSNEGKQMWKCRAVFLTLLTM